MRLGPAAACLLILTTLWSAAAYCADPAAVPPPEPRRAASDILKEWAAVSEQLRGLIPSPLAVADPEERVKIAPDAIPLIRKAIALNTEMYHASRDARPEARRNHYQFLAILALFDDKSAVDELTESQQSNVKEIADRARQAWFSSRWWRTNGDEKAGGEILDQLEKLAAASPADDSIAGVLLSFRQEGSATPDQDKRIQHIIATRLTGPLAQAATDQFKAADKRSSLVGKPLALTGPTVDGKAFDSNTLKGKYVLIHFGATWCGPWEEQHNQMLQAKWPANLAIVTVLCDQKEEPVRAYVQRHKEVPWTVLWPSSDQTDFAAQYGIEVLPNTILLDPEGKVIATDITPSEATVRDLIAPSPTNTNK